MRMFKTFTKKIATCAMATICVLSVFTTTAAAEVSRQEIDDF